jgi:hypothetical protein
VLTVHRSDTSLAKECGGVAARLRDTTRGGLHAGDALGAVLHASGVLRDAMLAGQRAGTVREVMAAKVAGGNRLGDACGVDAVDGTVMFSSIAALMGSSGQTNYSGANAALDAAAAAGRGAGRAAASVQWGAWGAVGMAANDPNILNRIEKMGMVGRCKLPTA